MAEPRENSLPVETPASAASQGLAPNLSKKVKAAFLLAELLLCHDRRLVFTPTMRCVIALDGGLCSSGGGC